MDIQGPGDRHDLGENQSPRGREPLGTEFTEVAHGRVAKDPRSAFDASPELRDLRQRLREVPEVRAELVARAVSKLRLGHFTTRESAERTAEVVLSTLQND